MSIVVPKNKVAFIDLDGTIIDSNYQISNVNLLIESIKQAKSQGWVLGLNSDTPLQALLPWQENLGLNGPIIAERGAVVWNDGIKTIIDTTSLKIFSEAKQELFRILADNGLPFFYCDTLSLLQRRVDFGLVSGEMALVNNMRECGIAFYVRSLNDAGQFELCNDRLREVVNVFEAWLHNRISSIIDFGFDLSKDLNADYSIYIVSNALMKKSVGGIYLMQENSWSEIAMIGNAMSDYMPEANVLHYAVGNSTEDFKSVANYVSPRNLSAGVAEILGQLA